MDILLLALAALIAGIVDAVVGGGGLIQIPALFSVLPAAQPAAVLGTNKLSALTGTSIAAFRYLKSVPVEWRATLPAAASAFIFAMIGARAVQYMPVALFRPIVLVLLIIVALYTFRHKNFGATHAPCRSGYQAISLAVVSGIVIGFYDGFFGPGTGSFLIFLFVRLFGFGFLQASASAKFVNVATNIAALLYFGFAEQIIYTVAIPMALCNGIGAIIGCRLAVTYGNELVRKLFLVVVGMFIIKFAFDTFHI